MSIAKWTAILAMIMLAAIASFMLTTDRTLDIPAVTRGPAYDLRRPADYRCPVVGEYFLPPNTTLSTEDLQVFNGRKTAIVIGLCR